MKKILTTDKTQKLGLAQSTIRILTDDSMLKAGGASASGCYFLTKPTNQNQCR